jgi:hypothetical protein
MRLWLLGWVAVLLLAALEPAQAGDFMDVRLSWVLAEGNFLAEPGDSERFDPGLGIGADESNTLFFDNYNTKYTGFETFGHLVLYKKMPAFFDGCYAEAALFTRIGRELRDEGSYIRLSYELPGSLGERNIALTLFPLSGDRFRLGYSYDLSWGGDDIFLDHRWYAPAARLRAELDWGYAFVGFKTARLREHLGDSEQTEYVTNYGTLAGAGLDLAGFLVELGGGYFSRGTLPQADVRGRYSYAGGLSYQLGYRSGLPIGTSIDFALYRDDPELAERFFGPEQYDGSLSWRLMHEGTVAFQRLAAADGSGGVVTQPAYAFDLNFALKQGYLRIHLDVVMKSLSFVLFDQPSFTPYQDFADEADAACELWAAVGLDYHFPGPRLTPGVKFGVLRPASYTIPDLVVDGAVFPGRRSVVVRGPEQRAVLPADEEVLWQWSLKASLKWDYAEMLALVAEVYYTRDPNLVRYQSGASGLNVQAAFADPDVLGLNLMAQARY